MSTTADTAPDVAADAAADRLPAGVDHVPLLREALTAARAVDRAVARLLEALLELDEHQLAEAITGVPLEQWLAIAGRRTRSDRRMLLTTCDVLRRLPSLRAAFLTEAIVSWAQTRTIALQVERLPRHLDDAIDAALARIIAATEGSDPDALSSAVSQALRSLEPTPSSVREPAQQAERFLAIQPRLDGSGGSIYGEFGGLDLATIDAALTPTPQHLRDGDVGRGRGVQARGRGRRLVELCDGALVGGANQQPHGDHHDQPPSDLHGQSPTDGYARREAGDGEGDDGEGDDGEGDDGDADDHPRGSRPQLLIRIELSSLLADGGLPGELLTRLTGGRLWADAATVRRLVDERGADLRAIVLDDTGGVVGVGRRTRVPPDWLRDAVLALHDTCTAPGCQRPALTSDLDHAHPWHRTRRDRPPGRTDIDELGPLCRTHNRTKESAGWEVSQTADGTRTWRHPATGLATITRPATWHPPPADRGGGDGASSDVGTAARGDQPADVLPGPDGLARETRGAWSTTVGAPSPVRPRAGPRSRRRWGRRPDG